MADRVPGPVVGARAVKATRQPSVQVRLMTVDEAAADAAGLAVKVADEAAFDVVAAAEHAMLAVPRQVLLEVPYMLHTLKRNGVVHKRDISLLFKEGADGLYLFPTPDEMRQAMAGVARAVAMAHSNAAALSAGRFAREALRHVLGAARKKNSPRAVAAALKLKMYEGHIGSSGFFQVLLGLRVQQSARTKPKPRVKQKLGW